MLTSLCEPTMTFVFMLHFISPSLSVGVNMSLMLKLKEPFGSFMNSKYISPAVHWAAEHPSLAAGVLASSLVALYLLKEKVTMVLVHQYHMHHIYFLGKR